jgi:hypothetical protein
MVRLMASQADLKVIADSMQGSGLSPKAEGPAC